MCVCVCVRASTCMISAALSPAMWMPMTLRVLASTISCGGRRAVREVGGEMGRSGGREVGRRRGGHVRVSVQAVSTHPDVDVDVVHGEDGSGSHTRHSPRGPTPLCFEVAAVWFPPRWGCLPQPMAPSPVNPVDPAPQLRPSLSHLDDQQCPPCVLPSTALPPPLPCRCHSVARVCAPPRTFMNERMGDPLSVFFMGRKELV